MNAVILAAGCGSRLKPLTLQLPKPLVDINGTSIIERQIQYLNESGVKEIFVVVGYLAERFYFLETKYNVRIIVNYQYEFLSNFHSLLLCEDVLSDTWIIEGDVFLTRNFFEKDLSYSVFFVGPKKFLQGDGQFIIDNRNKVTEIIPMEWTLEPVENEHKLLVPAGVSYWTRDVMRRLVWAMKQAVATGRSPSFRSWDYIVIENLADVDLSAKILSETDWFEIDSLFDYNLALEFDSNR